MTVLKKTQPIARKKHICMFCGGKINKGEKYERETCVNSGELYEWINHIKCSAVADGLGLFDSDDDLTGRDFCIAIFEYVNENHWDKKIDDVESEWDLKSDKLSEKIYDELIKNKRI